MMITVADAAIRLGVSRQRIGQYIKAGRLAVLRRYGPVRMLDVRQVDSVRRPTGRPRNEKKPTSQPPGRNAPTSAATTNIQRP